MKKADGSDDLTGSVNPEEGVTRKTVDIESTETDLCDLL